MADPKDLKQFVNDKKIATFENLQDKIAVKTGYWIWLQPGIYNIEGELNLFVTDAQGRQTKHGDTVVRRDAGVFVGEDGAWYFVPLSREHRIFNQFTHRFTIAIRWEARGTGQSKAFSNGCIKFRQKVEIDGGAPPPSSGL